MPSYDYRCKENNQVVKTFGKKPKFKFKAHDHMELAKRLDYKCRYIRLPNGYKDINEYFMGGYTLNDFFLLPREEVHIEHVEPLAKAIETLYEEQQTEPIVFQVFTPWVLRVWMNR